MARVIEIHGLASWLGSNDRVSSEGHVDTFSSAAFTSLRAEHNLGQPGGITAGSLAVVGFNIAVIKTHGTSGNIIGVRVILAALRKVGEMFYLMLILIPGLQTL